MAKLWTCPACGKRGVTERKDRKEGIYKCRYCNHYPGWLKPPEEKRGRRTLIREGRKND